jgi:hypothetical protein
MGSGAVRSTPAGIACSITGPDARDGCLALFSTGTTVTLTAVPGAGASFSGWGGPCASSPGATCTLTLTSTTVVGASFGGAPQALIVSLAGQGGGSVTASTGEIACPGVCAATLPSGALVTLTAAPNAGSTFAGWSGACAGTDPTCVVSMTSARNVSATFNLGGPSTYPLTVSVNGAAGATGTVTSTPSGITCPGTCTGNYAAGSSVTLTAFSANNSIFIGWDGPCVSNTTNTPTCTVAMNAARSVAATFRPATVALTVAPDGTGGGTVVSSPAGIVCPTVCTGSFPYGSSVTLTATPASGSIFVGWTGACSGQSLTCTTTLSDTQTSVTAIFTAVASNRLAPAPTRPGAASGTRAPRPVPPPR